MLYMEGEMTIYYIFNEYVAEGLGGLGHVWEVAEHLHKCGHKVIIFAPRVGTYRRSTPVKVVYVPTIDVRFLRLLVFNVVSFFYIFLFSFRQQPDVLYVRAMVLSLTPLIVSLLLRKPLITEVNGDSITELQSAGFSPILLAFVKLTHTINYRASNALVCVTHGLKHMLIRRFHIPADKIHVVPNGTNTELFRPMDQRACQRELSLDPARHFVGFVGTFLPHQGLDTLINSARDVINSFPHVMFVLIGDGKIRSTIEDHIHAKNLASHFLLTGSVPPEQVVRYINALDICVAPFTAMRNEAIGLSPLKLYDYLACNKPIVASDIKGVGDLITDHNLGIAVPPDDPVQLANAINTLLSNDQLRSTYSRNARQLIVHNYTWELTVQRILSVCFMVIAETKTRHS